MSTAKPKALSRRGFLSLFEAVVVLPWLVPAVATAQKAYAQTVVDLVKEYKLRAGTDITDAINAAIAAHPGKMLTMSGSDTYLQRDTGIHLNRPGTTLKLGATTLKLIPSSLGGYNMLTISAVNCGVIGGTIIGDVRTHKGTAGEWGHGINIATGATNARVSGTKIFECWGDGVYINAPGTKGILIDGVWCDRNRRQGISVIACGRGALIKGSACTNTGTVKFPRYGPCYGIDVEPNPGAGDIMGLTIEKCYVSGNRGGGILLVAVARTASVADISGCTITGNSGYGIRSIRKIGAGTIAWKISSTTVSGNKEDGVRLSAPVALSNVRSTGNGKYGFSFLSGSRGSVATNCVAEHNSAGSRRSEFTIRDRVTLNACIADPKGRSNYSWCFKKHKGTKARKGTNPKGTVMKGCKGRRGRKGVFFYGRGTR